MEDDIRDAMAQWKLMLFRGIHLKRIVCPVGIELGKGREGQPSL